MQQLMRNFLCGIRRIAGRLSIRAGSKYVSVHILKSRKLNLQLAMVVKVVDEFFRVKPETARAGQ